MSLILSFKEYVYLLIGHFCCRLTRARNRAQIEKWKASMGSADPSAFLEYPLKIANPRCIHIGPGARVSWGGWLCAITEYYDQRFSPEIRIGADSYVGNHCHIVACRKVTIGREVLVADRVYISDNLHGYRDIRRSVMKNDNVCLGEVHIGDHSWLGENVCVFGDVRIGRHCVVGANSVLNRSLPPYSVAVGAPARIVKRYHSGRREWLPTDPDGCFVEDPDFDPPKWGGASRFRAEPKPRFVSNGSYAPANQTHGAGTAPALGGMASCRPPSASVSDEGRLEANPPIWPATGHEPKRFIDGSIGDP